MKRFLLIDTANQPARVAIATAPKVMAESTVADRHQLSEQLLGRIDELCERSSQELGKLAAIGVVSGPGPFTALRIGAAVANALAYAHHLPIVTAIAAEVPSTKTFAGLVAERLTAGKTVTAVLPDYGREPTITPPKPRPKPSTKPTSQTRRPSSGSARRTR